MSIKVKNKTDLAILLNSDKDKDKVQIPARAVVKIDTKFLVDAKKRIKGIKVIEEPKKKIKQIAPKIETENTDKEIDLSFTKVKKHKGKKK